MLSNRIKLFQIISWWHLRHSIILKWRKRGKLGIWLWNLTLARRMTDWNEFFFNRSWRRWASILLGAWILECIGSVTYSILVNGKGHIVPPRGTCQGDHLSPYLFLICSKGLNGLIEHALADKHIKGFSLCRNGPKTSHPFFANDNLLFCWGRLDDVRSIQEILRKFE